MSFEGWIGRVIDGRYVVESVLGSGGMGVVLRARHRYTGALLALKTLRAELQLDAGLEARFLAEARAPNTIGHPGIVQVLDAGKTPEGELYLAMELLAGEPLRHAVSRGLGAPSVRRIGLELLDALGAAHARGFVHRDLKPENVFLVAPNATVKLLDFGIAKVVAHGGTVAGNRTAAGVVLGTLAYMAPEQLADASGVDPRADLWAMGVMLYEMLSGRLPYRVRTVEEMFVALASQAPDPIKLALPSAAPELEVFFARALARDPRARFGSAAEMAAALGQLPLGAATPPPAARPATGVATAATGFAATGANGFAPTAASGAGFVPASTPQPGGPPVGAAITAAPVNAPPVAHDRGARSRRLGIALGAVSAIAIIAAIAIAARGGGTTKHGNRTDLDPQAVAKSEPAPEPAAPPPAAATPHVTPTPEPAVQPPAPRPAAAPVKRPTPPPRTVPRQEPAPQNPYATTPTAPAPSTDPCVSGCAMLQRCGLPDATCVQDCRSNMMFSGCIAAAQGSCNQFAACVFAVACRGVVPSGTSTCNAAMNCESHCGNDVNCGCGCTAQMANVHALALFKVNACATVCKGDVSCIQKNCAAYITACTRE